MHVTCVFDFCPYANFTFNKVKYYVIRNFLTAPPPPPPPPLHLNVTTLQKTAFLLTFIIIIIINITIDERILWTLWQISSTLKKLDITTAVAHNSFIQFAISFKEIIWLPVPSCQPQASAVFSFQRCIFFLDWQILAILLGKYTIPRTYDLPKANHQLLERLRCEKATKKSLRSYASYSYSDSQDLYPFTTVSMSFYDHEVKES